MKCDELKEHYYYEDMALTPATHLYRVYHADEAEEAIAELKAENLDLKAKNVKLQSFYDLHGNVDNYIDKLKAENERIRKVAMGNVEELRKFHADELRSTRRALWLARAEKAKAWFCYWCSRFAVESGFTKCDINGYSVNTTRTLRTIGDWINLWKNVEQKCMAKAEEYK